jgi:hypothetical protein
MRSRLASTLRRLDKVESVLVAEDGSARGGVMRVPAILGLSEWEALAVPMQQELVRSSHEDLERRQAEEPATYRHPMPARVVAAQRTHTPDPHRSQEAVPIKRPPLPPTLTR